jgi:YD repeat-containing protein
MLLWVLWLGCADEAPTPSGDESVDAIPATPTAACRVQDLWFDLAGAPALEEERGFDADGRPLWHAVDGVIGRTWGYDDQGRPSVMQVGDPLDPDQEFAYTYDADGQLDRVYLGSGDVVQLTWSDDGHLQERTVLDASGAAVETTRWTFDEGRLVSWVTERGGDVAVVAERETFDDGVSYLERQDDVVSGTWLELLEVVGPDGAPEVARVSTAQGSVEQVWARDGEGWRLFAVWSTTGADWVQLADEVVYRFDERGREVERTVDGEGASPFQRRERTWGCDVDVQRPFVPPLDERPSVFYVSPIYVDPPSL